MYSLLTAVSTLVCSMWLILLYFFLSHICLNIVTKWQIDGLTDSMLVRFCDIHGWLIFVKTQILIVKTSTVYSISLFHYFVSWKIAVKPITVVSYLKEVMMGEM